MPAVLIHPPLPADATLLEAPTRPHGGVRAGAGLGGLHVSEVDRSHRLAAMHAGEMGSIHSWELVTAVDGPGTRLTVFVSGCPLRCLYCQNPDTLSMKDGKPVEVEELLARIRRYLGVFTATGGGLTISGGEVLMQPAFAARILRGAKELGVHTALDTSGYLGANVTDAMLDDTDLVLLDVKAGTTDLYKRVTGRDLEPTREFGRRLARHGLGSKGPEVWIRYVLVPGLTDGAEGVDRVGAYVASLNEIRPDTVTRVEVLPFHQLGRSKWEAIGREYELGDTEPPSPELVERVRGQFRSHGLLTY